jgi:branched-chain amino acid transport system permease protein
MIAGLTRYRLVVVCGLVGLLAFPLIADLLGDPFLIVLATRIVIYAIAVAGLDLIIGFGGMVSFGHAAFFGLGAYTIGILAHHALDGSPLPFLPFAWTGTLDGLVQFPLAIAVAAVFAAIVGVLSLRTTGVFFIMITLAFAQMLFLFFVSLPTYNGEDGLNVWERSRFPLLNLYDDYHLYYLATGLLIVVIWLLRRIVNSRFGMVLRAGKQNERRLTTLGVPVNRYRLAAFTIAGATAGLSGALAANLLEFVGPGMMHWTRSGEFMVMVILGGMGSIYGALAGAVALLGLEEMLTGLTEHWALFLGPILVLVVLFARAGVFGLLAGKDPEK